MNLEFILVLHASYLVFYTGFDKQTKSLNLSLLWDVLAFRRSVEFTIVEINKVLALSGLTLCGWSVITLDTSMLVIATVELVIHGMFSGYHFYGSNNIPRISDWTFSKTKKELSSRSAKERLLPKRKLSILCSVLCTMILEVWFLGYLDLAPAVCMAFLSLGVIHFYTMEIDFRGKLNVRPPGFLAFIAPIVAIAMTVYYYHIFSAVKSNYPFAFEA